MSNFHFVNLWKYWKKDYLTRDLSVIELQLYDDMWGGTRIVLFNIGIVWRWRNRTPNKDSKLIDGGSK